MIIKYNGYKPTHGTEQSTGWDIALAETLVMDQTPGTLYFGRTHLRLAIPYGVDGQLRPRSSLGRLGLLLAGVGTIDADYRGEILIPLFKLGSEPLTVPAGTRLAQIVFTYAVHVSWTSENHLVATARGEGGFGSTGSV